MDPDLIPRKLVYTAIIVVANFGAILLPVVLGLLLPGRKGQMRTTRTHLFTGIGLEEMRRLFATRLEYERFRVSVDAQTGALRGRRNLAKERDGSDMLHTHASKPFECLVEFTPQADGVETRLTMWTTDFVFMDTGEGAYIDQLMHRLLFSDQAAEAPPMVPNRSFFATAALVCALIIVVVPVLLILPGMRGNAAWGIVEGMLFSSITPFVLAGITFWQSWRKPQEITGNSWAVAAILVALLGIAEALAIAGWKLWV